MNEEANKRIHHVTNDECLDGTQRVPKRFKPCCDAFDYRTKSCLYEVRYEKFARGKWGIRLSDIVGGGWIWIRHCPHCGKKL